MAVWTFVYWCKWVNIGQFLLLIWPRPVNTLLVHGTEPEPETEPEPKLLSFHSIIPYNPISVGTAEESGLQWAPGRRRQSHLFTERLHKHIGSRKSLPLIAGNHGNWHQWQEMVSWNACAWNLIRAAAAALEALGEQRRFFFWGGGVWLIGEEQSGYSCQILRMNANKSPELAQAHILKKERSDTFNQETDTANPSHTHWWKSSRCTRAWNPVRPLGSAKRLVMVHHSWGGSGSHVKHFILFLSFI